MKQWRITVNTEGGKVTPHDWADVKADRDGDGIPDRAQKAAANYARGGVWDGATFHPGGRVLSVVVEMRDKPADKPAPKKPAAKKPAPKAEAAPKAKAAKRGSRTRTR